MNSVLPKVSVVIITNGQEKFIAYAMKAVFIQQTNCPIEWSVANDFSFET